MVNGEISSQTTFAKEIFGMLGGSGGGGFCVDLNCFCVVFVNCSR